MTAWTLVYEGFDPDQEGVRETLCTLGNGYFTTRGAATYAQANDTHYPGTYLAGGYNRLRSAVAGKEIENEDLVNLPNWLPLTIAIDGDDPIGPSEMEHLDYRQVLDLRRGMLQRTIRFRDPQGRITRWDERRIVSMDQSHVAALSVTVAPENWSGRLTVISALDGRVTNYGVPRYRNLDGQHLETLELTQPADDSILLRTRMVQSRREVVLAARTRLHRDGRPLEAERQTEQKSDRIAQKLTLDAGPDAAVTVEKVVALYSINDTAMSEPGLEASKRLRRVGGFEELFAAHCETWKHLWGQADLAIDTDVDGGTQMKLRLHVFHLLQTVSTHSIDLDVGVPPRGWHGEAYRGHIMWDELFIFPYLTLRMPVLTRALLRYRYRRLPEARHLAKEAGCRGAMFPWQSGSDGREESQHIHLNPMSGRWIPDNSWRQRHIGAAIAYNVWQYYETTEDRRFMADFGAELLFEIARFWASMARYNPRTGRYDIRRVMGPDEFHTAYPGADPREEGGIDNNAYTNVMVSWLLTRALDVIDLLPHDRHERLRDLLGLDTAELEQWDEISRNLAVPFHDDGIISQFEGYEKLKDFDWEGYREKYGDLQRLDRILEAEDDHPNNYKVSKQADVLMLFFLFSTEELGQIFERLGYDFSPEMISKNINYYMQRTSHGSTLSWVAHAWVLARSDRPRSWDLFCTALNSDFHDLQGGTTEEGIHLGAMAGTVDLIQRCYTGIEVRSNTLTFNPLLPEELNRLETTLHYRGQTLDIAVTRESLVVSSRPFTALPVTIAYRGHVREIGPGQSYRFRLIEHKVHHRAMKERYREELHRCGPRPPGESHKETA